MNSLKLKHIFVGIAIGCFTMFQVAGQEPDDSADRKLKVELAEVGLKLAELELQQAEHFNREIAIHIENRVTLDEASKSRMLATKQLSAETMERLTSNVAVAKASLERAKSPNAKDTEDLLLQHAAENVRLCKARWDQAKVVAPTSQAQGQVNLERARLRHQEAVLRYDLLQQSGGLDNAVETLFVRTNRLSEEHIALEQRVASLEQMFLRERLPRE